MNFFRRLFNRITEVKKKNLVKEVRELERRIKYYETEAKLLERQQIHLLEIEGPGILYNPKTYLQTFIDEYRDKANSLRSVLEQKRRKLELL